MADLEAATPFNARTIRYYIAQGMIASPTAAAPPRPYDEDHLLRLRMIAELKAQYLPLEQISERLSALTTDDLVAHFAIQRAPNEQRWRRILVHPDLELHVRDRPAEGLAGRDAAAFEHALEQITSHVRLVLQHYERDRQPSLPPSPKG
jgi:DNA-binding transcriptional MerR regulator